MKMGYEELRAICIVAEGTVDPEVRTRVVEQINKSELPTHQYEELSFYTGDVGFKKALKSKQKAGD